MSDVKQPATPTPKRNILEGLRMLERTGEGNYLTQAYPKLSGFLESALMGTAPDQLGGSVLDPQTAQRRAGAEYGFPVGLAAMLAPAVGPLTKVGRGIAEAPSMVAGSRAAQRGVIKAPGGNWLSGSVEDALMPLRRFPGHDPASAPQQEMLNNFIDKQLTKYIKNDMATERDPIRALAERGVLHFKPEMVPINPAKEAIQEYRMAGGFPKDGLGKSQLAREWEALTDYPVSTRTAGSIVNDPGGLAPFNIAKDPWLETVAPGTKVYRTGANSLEDSTHFKHLMDELRNATNINSGLPAHLRLDPESLARVSVPQAVERVAKINDWRAAQKVAADQARANNAATVLHKDYGDKGFKWVELKQPVGVPEETLKTLTASQRKDYELNINAGDTPLEALRGVVGDKDPISNSLRDALTYEGDTMGHCVGGYCDDVASGKSRIYSLRDAKGQPHTTIEVMPGHTSNQAFWDQEVKAYRDVYGRDPSDEYMLSELNMTRPGSAVPGRIVQIKGKGNKAPNPEYLPYVQDFVKSGKWSDVGDLQNSGLRRATDAWNPNEEKLIRAAGIEFPTHATQQEIDAINQQVWPGVMGPAKPPGYADGGSVRAMVNAAVGSSNLAKQVGNSADAVRSIAAGTGSMGDLNSLRQMAASMGYTSPGLSQAMGLAGAAKAGYNAMNDPSARNLAGFASSVNPLAAKALSIYNAVTNPEPAGFVDALASFNPLTSAWNTLARAADFATLGQVVRNVNKISDPNAPAELRDMLSNNPNSASLTRNANDLSALTGRDSLDTMMDMTGAFGTEPGYSGYYSGNSGAGGGTTSAPNGGGSFPSYSGGDGVNGSSNAGGYGGFGGF